jgi:hypothetical protein
MIETAVYSATSYDRTYLAGGQDGELVDWRFHEFPLSAATAPTAAGSQAVCLFVNDKADSACMSALKSGHVGGVALDVYEEEEGLFSKDLSVQVLQDDELARLLTFRNVLITAHQALLMREALPEIARVTTRNLLNHQAGLPSLRGTTL